MWTNKSPVNMQPAPQINSAQSIRRLAADFCRRQRCAMTASPQIDTKKIASRRTKTISVDAAL